MMVGEKKDGKETILRFIDLPSLCKLNNRILTSFQVSSFPQHS